MDALWYEGEGESSSTDIATGGTFSEPADAAQSGGVYAQLWNRQREVDEAQQTLPRVAQEEGKRGRGDDKEQA
jgi:hypothetical protein